MWAWAAPISPAARPSASPLPGPCCGGADFLLLDEATSNLDVTSEALVTDALNKLMENRTTIMIAHSYAATKNAHNVIVMCDGTVEAQGTPAELEETNEYYKLFSRTL